ncbi:hypothetical protein MKEN_00575900 [Mycena kentingensis (nom. inval.)]|nr:hypothetical protein MKEN_00575900 [Mycena kentingensis (nom. inval.)]
MQYGHTQLPAGFQPSTYAPAPQYTQQQQHHPAPALYAQPGYGHSMTQTRPAQMSNGGYTEADSTSSVWGSRMPDDEWEDEEDSDESETLGADGHGRRHRGRTRVPMSGPRHARRVADWVIDAQAHVQAHDFKSAFVAKTGHSGHHSSKHHHHHRHWDKSRERRSDKPRSHSRSHSHSHSKKEKLPIWVPRVSSTVTTSRSQPQPHKHASKSKSVPAPQAQAGSFPPARIPYAPIPMPQPGVPTTTSAAVRQSLPSTAAAARRLGTILRSGAVEGHPQKRQAQVCSTAKDGVSSFDTSAEG